MVHYFIHTWYFLRCMIHCIYFPPSPPPLPQLLLHSLLISPLCAPSISFPSLFLFPSLSLSPSNPSLNHSLGLFPSSISVDFRFPFPSLILLPHTLSQCYHPRSDQWSTVSPLPIQRSGFGSAVVDGMLYLAGGCNNLSKVSSVDCYNPEKDEWTTVAPMSIRRSGLGVGVAPAFLF